MLFCEATNVRSNCQCLQRKQGLQANVRVGIVRVGIRVRPCDLNTVGQDGGDSGVLLCGQGKGEERKKMKGVTQG